jgi:hypothetical protein
MAPDGDLLRPSRADWIGPVGDLAAPAALPDHARMAAKLRVDGRRAAPLGWRGAVPDAAAVQAAAVERAVVRMPRTMWPQ